MNVRAVVAALLASSAWVGAQPLPGAGPSSPAPAGAVFLEEVRMEGDRVRLRLSRAVPHALFPLEGPDRLVVDLSGVVRLSEGATEGGGRVRRLRTWQQGTAGARVVLDLDGPARFAARWEGNTLLLEPQTEPGAEPGVAFRDAVAAIAAVPPAPPRLPASLDRVRVLPRIGDISAGPDEVAVTLSAPVEHRAFLTAHPPRLVLELQGVQAAGRTLPGTGRFLRGVRVAQFGLRPPVARVVLDLRQTVRYWAGWEADRLVVRLAPAAEAADPRAGGLLSYTGRLLDGAGRPLDGSFLLTFELAAPGRPALWHKARYVRVRRGRFTALLDGGSGADTPPDARLAAFPPAGMGWRVE